MKKLILFFATLLVVQFSSAQYCGNSGPAICTPSGTLTQPGLFPLSPQLPPVINGTSTNTTIQFKNFNQVTYSGFTVSIDSLRLDSIGNLPAGTCWATNKSRNTFGNSESGCINLIGTPCTAPGQYKMVIKVTVWVPGFGSFPTDAESAGLRYYIRVNNPCETATAVDTAQTALFAAYGSAANCTNAPSLALSAPTTVCSGVVDTLRPIVCGGVGALTYAWAATGSTSLSCNNCANPIVTITQPSTYTVTVTDANSQSVTASVTVGISSSAGFSLTTAANSFCTGKSTVVTAPTGNGYSYAWYRNGTLINGAASSTYTATDSGSYSAIITLTGGCKDSSNVVNLAVNPLPVVSFTPAADTFCNHATAVTLAGGLPAGGTFTVDHISATQFNPNSVTVGNHVVTYTYTDNNGCTDSAAQTFVTKTCVGIDEVALETAFAIYPNPANNVVYIESNQFNANTVTPVVFDISGKAVNAPYVRNGNIFTVNTGSLSAGTYLVKFAINGQQVTKRFVKAAE